MSNRLEQRVQEALDRGALDADQDLRAQLEGDTPEARAARLLVEVDQALRSLPRPAPESDIAGAVLSRLDAPLDDIGDVLADPIFDQDEDAGLASSEFASAASGFATPPAANAPAQSAPAARPAADGKVVELASRRRWRAPLWLGGGLAAAAALALVMTTKLDAPQEAASVGYADPAAAPYPMAEESAAPSVAPSEAHAPGAPAAAPAAAFADETVAEEQRDQVRGSAGWVSGPEPVLAEAPRDEAVEAIAADDSRLSAGLRGALGGAAETEADRADDFEGRGVRRARARRAPNAERSGGMSSAMTAAPTASSATTTAQEQGAITTLESRVMACVSSSALALALSATDGRVVRFSAPDQALTPEERRCVDRVVVGSPQSTATRRVTFRR